MWNIMTGSLSIIPNDLKPLHPAHIEALVLYCMWEDWSMERCMHVPDGVAGPKCRDLTPFIDPNYQASATQLLAQMTKVGFSECFALLMNVIGRKKYGEVPSPYDV
jgi:hypothetical protein